MNICNFLVILSLILSVGCTIPDYIHLCHSDDPKPQLAQCIINSITELTPLLRVGIPELDIPAIEPLLFKNATLNTGTGSTRIDTHLRNILVWNVSNFKILELEPVLSKNFFRFKTHFPSINLEGNYVLDSKVLFLELEGNGRFNINLTNFMYEAELQGHKVTRDNAEYLEFEKLKIQIQFEHGNIYLDNLYNGNPVLGKSINAIINDNLDIFFPAMKSNFEDVISETVTDIANKITRKFLYRELFPKSTEV